MKYMKFRDLNFIDIYSCIIQESSSAFKLMLNRATSKLVSTDTRQELPKDGSMGHFQLADKIFASMMPAN